MLVMGVPIVRPWGVVILEVVTWALFIIWFCGTVLARFKVACFFSGGDNSNGLTIVVSFEELYGLALADMLLDAAEDVTAPVL